MSVDRQAFLRSWKKFLDPEMLRGNLVSASIFLAAYEILKTAIVDRIKTFFTNGFDENGFTVDEEYVVKVRSLDKSELRASLLWLRSMDVIDDSDMQRFDQIRKHRNEIAHELFKFATSPDNEIQIELLQALIQLLAKIERWWIREVELPSDSDYDGRDIADEDIQPASLIFLQMMIDIAVGKDSSSYLEAFRELAKRSSPEDAAAVFGQDAHHETGHTSDSTRPE